MKTTDHPLDRKQTPVKLDMTKYMTLAQRTLARIDFDSEPLPSPGDGIARVTISNYENGREKGFHLQLRIPASRSRGARTLCISFSEYRSADDVVVYAGEGFDAETGTPGEEAYAAAQFFARPEVAAEYITNLLRDPRGVPKKSKRIA